MVTRKIGKFGSLLAGSSPVNKMDGMTKDNNKANALPIDPKTFNFERALLVMAISGGNEYEIKPTIVNKVSNKNNIMSILKNNVNWLPLLAKGIQLNMNNTAYTNPPKRIYGILLPYFFDLVRSSIKPRSGSFNVFHAINIIYAIDVKNKPKPSLTL
jgi:hypothetical protein